MLPPADTHHQQDFPADTHPQQDLPADMRPQQDLPADMHHQQDFPADMYHNVNRRTRPKQKKKPSKHDMHFNGTH